MQKLKRVTIGVDPVDYAQFENLASNSGLSASWLIRKAMREFLATQGTKQGIFVECPSDSSSTRNAREV